MTGSWGTVASIIGMVREGQEKVWEGARWLSKGMISQTMQRPWSACTRWPACLGGRAQGQWEETGQGGSHHQGSGSYLESHGIFRYDVELKEHSGCCAGQEAGQKLGCLCNIASNPREENTIHSRKGPC